jgi:DNA-binding CsgD family transcriptional regulator
MTHPLSPGSSYRARHIAKLSAKLTDREKEVVDLVIESHNNESIGNQLDISVETVKRHLYNIFVKLSVVSRTELAVTILNRRHAVELAEAARSYAFVDFQSN